MVCVLDLSADKVWRNRGIQRSTNLLIAASVDQHDEVPWKFPLVLATNMAVLLLPSQSHWSQSTICHTFSRMCFLLWSRGPSSMACPQLSTVCTLNQTAKHWHQSPRALHHHLWPEVHLHILYLCESCLMSVGNQHRARLLSEWSRWKLLWGCLRTF